MPDKVLMMAEHSSVYHGNKEPKHISGSQFGSSMLQLWLANKYGKDIKPFRVGQNTIGSIFHLGMETAAKQLFGEEVLTEHAVSRVLPNGWTITGTIDLVDREEKEIVDYKTGKMYSLKVQKQEPRHGYNLQLNAYKWAAKLPDYRMYDAFFMKDNKEIIGEKAYIKHEVKDIPTFVTEAVDFTNELQDWIERDEAPPKCDTWMRMDDTKAKGGKLVPSRCLLYCDVAQSCPHLEPYIVQQFQAKCLTNG